jgi:hypothetical protein
MFWFAVAEKDFALRKTWTMAAWGGPGAEEDSVFALHFLETWYSPAAYDCPRIWPNDSLPLLPDLVVAGGEKAHSKP